MSDIDDRIANAPLPTDRTLRRRNGLVTQAWRFAVINLRMIRCSHTPPVSH